MTLLGIFVGKIDEYVDFQLLYQPQHRPKCRQCGADDENQVLNLYFGFQLTAPNEIPHYLKHSSAGNLTVKSFQPFHINALTSGDLPHTSPLKW